VTFSVTIEFSSFGADLFLTIYDSKTRYFQILECKDTIKLQFTHIHLFLFCKERKQKRLKMNKTTLQQY
jgi:hypothetical protein